MSNLLQLTLFGSPEIRRHEQTVTGFRSSKAQALLYYLAVTGRSHTCPTLAGLFWGDQPDVAERIAVEWYCYICCIMSLSLSILPVSGI